MEKILEVTGLKKTFTLSKKQQAIEKTKTKKRIAVNGLSFTAYRGEIFGLLGPNGAGKTTTLRILSTLIRPDEGDATLDGYSLKASPSEVRARIGFLTSENKLDEFFTPRYHFDFATGWEDICCKNGPLVNMDFFKSVVFPCYKRIGNKLHQYGVDIWYTDCDGDVRPLLPYFLEAGINCLFPYEVNSCAHPGELFDEFGKDLRIMGGFDKMQLIKGKDAIKAYMKTLEPLVARGGYIPFCDHRCPPDVTPENYLYYLDLKEKTFGLE